MVHIISLPAADVQLLVDVLRGMVVGDGCHVVTTRRVGGDGCHVVSSRRVGGVGLEVLINTLELGPGGVQTHLDGFGTITSSRQE